MARIGSGRITIAKTSRFAPQRTQRSTSSAAHTTEHIQRGVLRNVDIIIASDICFCHSLIDPLRRLIQRAKKACVERILISDPGRWPFDDLCDLFIGEKGVELIEWQAQEPSPVNGKILSMQFR